MSDYPHGFEKQDRKGCKHKCRCRGRVCENAIFVNQTLYAQLVNPCYPIHFNYNRKRNLKIGEHMKEREKVNVFYQYEA